MNIFRVVDVCWIFLNLFEWFFNYQYYFSKSYYGFKTYNLKIQMTSIYFRVILISIVIIQEMNWLFTSSSTRNQKRDYGVKRIRQGAEIFQSPCWVLPPQQKKEINFFINVIGIFCRRKHPKNWINTPLSSWKIFRIIWEFSNPLWLQNLQIVLILKWELFQP